MKTIITSVKKIICNVILFLISLELTYSIISHHKYGTPYPYLFIIIICLPVATFASIKKEKHNEQ
jgi:predicted tellurium resistance membrane protein TerC